MKVVTIIVSYNGMKWIDLCLKSVVNQCEVVVVDNNSSDNTVSLIKHNFPQVKVLQQNENLGFGKANNIGISYAIKNGAEGVFLLNQDTIVEFNTLQILINVAKKNPQFGIISPIHLNWDGTAFEYNFASYLNNENIPSIFPDFIIRNKTKDIYESKFINAAAWLIPNKSLLEVGGFDPMFRHYGEDDNYCQRMLFHNYKIGVVPNAFIKHEGNKKEKGSNYLFSDRYFDDYAKMLQVMYANINIQLNGKESTIEKQKVLKKMVKSILKLRFNDLRNYLIQYKRIDTIFKKINESRNTTQKIGPHFI